EGDRRDDRRGLVARLCGDVCKFEELSSGVRPTCSFNDRTWHSLRFVERVESRIGVGLEYPAIAAKMPLRMLARAIARVEEHRGRRVSAAKWLIIAYVSPQPPGPAFHLGEHRHRRVVAMNARGSEHVRLDELMERHQRRRASADVIRHGRYRQ